MKKKNSSAWPRKQTLQTPEGLVFERTDSGMVIRQTPLPTPDNIAKLILAGSQPTDKPRVGDLQQLINFVEALKKNLRPELQPEAELVIHFATVAMSAVERNDIQAVVRYSIRAGQLVERLTLRDQWEPAVQTGRVMMEKNRRPRSKGWAAVDAALATNPKLKPAEAIALFKTTGEVPPSTFRDDFRKRRRGK